jgi:hypothetical protein
MGLLVFEFGSIKSYSKFGFLLPGSFNSGIGPPLLGLSRASQSRLAAKDYSSQRSQRLFARTFSSPIGLNQHLAFHREESFVGSRSASSQPSFQLALPPSTTLRAPSRASCNPGDSIYWPRSNWSLSLAPAEYASSRSKCQRKKVVFTPLRSCLLLELVVIKYWEEGV